MNYITTPGTISGVTFAGPVEVTVPDVTFDTCRFLGTRRDDILLTMHHRTKVLNSVLLGSPNGAHRGIRADGTGCRISKSRILNIFSDIQTNGIAGWEGCSDLGVEDSEIEASGENIIFGGAYCANEKLIPQDITLRNLVLSKPKRWLEDPRVTCVNHFEIKNGKRITATNIRATGSVPGGGQEGYSIVLTVRQDPAPFCTIEDVALEGWEIEDTCGGITTLGHDDMFPPPQEGFGRLKHVTLKDLHFRRMAPYSRQVHLNSGSKNLRIIGLSVSESPDTNSLITFTNPAYVNEGFEYRLNDVPEGHYGIIGDNGTTGATCLEAYAPGCVFEGNTIREQSGEVAYPRP